MQGIEETDRTASRSLEGGLGEGVSWPKFAIQAIMQMSWTLLARASINGIE
jgi:hypothetical protein